jgi:hypothetical protein
MLAIDETVAMFMIVLPDLVCSSSCEVESLIF